MPIEIESRSLPLIDNASDKERYRVRSSGGFLDIGESFLSRLAEDDKKVKEIGVTHAHLGRQLELVLQQSREVRNKFGIGPDPKVKVDFCYQTLSSEVTQASPQILEVSHRSFAGAQWSFFRNLDPEAKESDEDRLSWQEDHEICNIGFPSIVLKIAGGIGTGIAHYISKHGFYEGGKANFYRVDPAVLHWVLTGIVSRNAIESMEVFYNAQINEIDARIRAQEEELKSSSPPIDPEVLSPVLAHLSTSCELEKEEWKQKLVELRKLKI